ncbi:MAG: flagellar basal-body MS-ring/collar protein FliF [Gammaproteobacteria bacterium]|nr:flagellar basal-body MS-ring/collar protein FliF [Gammaproteobacteria bacterium]MDH5800649.1 flagellar basal-body MS-ring/collar protein FliF [Gammaproteobacteria bacterium]
MQNSNNKALLIAGGSVIVILTLVALVWVFSSSYTVLFKDLESLDAAAAVEELDKMKVEYKIQDGGSTILVPDSKVHQVRLSLMASDAKIKSGVGFELFDESDFGMTEYVQKINYQRALQGELSRTISSLNEVKYAKVLLVMRESGLFKKKEETARASVILFLKDGKTLSVARIDGIQKLVASSVPGLLASNVVVTDQDGKTLSRRIEVSESLENIVSVGDRLQKRKDIETYLESKALKILEKTFGPNQAMVSIDATINFNKVNTTSETVISDNGGVVRKKEISNNGKKSNTSKEVEYRVGKVIDQVQMAPGSIDRLSIGVIVPENTPRERVNKIKELVAMAAGYSDARGDDIVVHAVAMVKPPAVAEQQAIVESSDVTVAEGMALPSSQLQSAKQRIAKLHQEQLQVAKGLANPVESNTDPKREELAFIGAELLQYRNVFLALSAILVVAAIGLFLWVRSRKRYQLSIVERENALAQIRVWLDGDDKATVSEVRQW